MTLDELIHWGKDKNLPGDWMLISCGDQCVTIYDPETNRDLNILYNKWLMDAIRIGLSDKGGVHAVDDTNGIRETDG